MTAIAQHPHHPIAMAVVSVRANLADVADSLIGGLKAAKLDTGETISASLARRLACEAGIIPAVLGGSSEASTWPLKTLPQESEELSGPPGQR